LTRHGGARWPAAFRCRSSRGAGERRQPSTSHVGMVGPPTPTNRTWIRPADFDAPDGPRPPATYVRGRDRHPPRAALPCPWVARHVAVAGNVRVVCRRSTPWNPRRRVSRGEPAGPRAAGPRQSSTFCHATLADDAEHAWRRQPAHTNGGDLVWFHTSGCKLFCTLIIPNPLFSSPLASGRLAPGKICRWTDQPSRKLDRMCAQTDTHTA
jgi:hypothetical protein